MSEQKNQQEVEVKILNINPKKIKAKLQELKAEKIKNVFQTNQYFKIPHQEKKRTIRIRKEEDVAFLTIKQKHSKENGVRNRNEFETIIPNPDQLEEIFLAMGLSKERLYEMKRQYYQLEGCSVEIVHMATIPTYLEIEGEKENIYNVAKKLGFSEDDFLKESFYKAYPQTKERDMLFENEKNN